MNNPDKRLASIEQENVLAKLACAKRLTKKHWRLLKASGLASSKRQWVLTPAAELFIEMITMVHGPHMEMDEAALWHNVLRWSDSPDLLCNFWEAQDHKELLLRAKRQRNGW